ncbi:hypothetical protein [Paracoccus marinaquae]|uniref:Uncharacterized protein n=1 Tax=Paracoccus marinaquae TaxID=2841926 RepID=A0ABS6AGC0_9RHOB|nr:hypothetical protein [Paracoccus marinaquae]MBU3029630.1 hypothetical protein [Paracoccus marinaquae]
MSPLTRITALARRDATTTIGVALTAAWLLLVLLFWLLAPGEAGRPGGVAWLLSAIGVVLPLGLIWMAVGLARSVAALRAEADDLRQRLSQLREYAATRGAPLPSAEGRRAAPAPAEPRHAPPQPAATAARAPQPRAGAAAAPRTRPVDSRQTAMPFDTPEPVDIAPETLIRALNFPDGPDDGEAIAALRLALKDHENSRVLRAAQDVVTLLAAQDIYMDDLPPDLAPAAVWRRQAEGARGSAIAALGGIHDEIALEVASVLLRGDEIFRDTAHHFLRHFDGLLSRLVPQLDDDQIAILADTRSARAFMLVGRAAGIFG